MTIETLGATSTEIRQNPYFAKQILLVKKIRNYTGTSSGDDFNTLGLHINYDPSTFELTLQNTLNSVISLTQSRIETFELGVKSRLTLKIKTTDEKGESTSTYRLSDDKAMKSYVNGSDPKFTEMSQQDLWEYAELLNIISGKLC